MIRHLFNIVAALSLLLCVATAVFWVRSYRVSDWLVRTNMADPVRADHDWGLHMYKYDVAWWNELSVGWNRGELWLMWRECATKGPSWDGRIERGWKWAHGEAYDYELSTREQWLGGWFFFPRPGGEFDRNFVVSCFVVLFCAALLPSVWLIRRVRAIRRRADGKCLSCGYDLRAGTDRCPECGTPIPFQARICINFRLGRYPAGLRLI